MGQSRSDYISNGRCPILNLQQRNTLIRKSKFHMVTLASIIPSLPHGAWFVALGMDAYFHIDIHPAHQKFLHFQLGHHHYPFQVLPFIIATGP